MAEGLKCPKCGCLYTVVKWKENKLDAIYRRRECEECGYRFTTYEFGNEMVKRIKDRAWEMGMMDWRMRTDAELSTGE